MSQSECPTPPELPTPPPLVLPPVLPANLGAALAELGRIGRQIGEVGMNALDQIAANGPLFNLGSLGLDVGRGPVAAAAAAQRAAVERAAMWPGGELRWSAVIARIAHRSPERVLLHHDGRSPVRAHGPTLVCPMWYDVDDPDRAGRYIPAGRVLSARIGPHLGGLSVFAEGTMPHDGPAAAALLRHGTLAARADVSGAVQLEPDDDGLTVMHLRDWRLCGVEVFPPAVSPGVCRIWITGDDTHSDDAATTAAPARAGAPVAAEAAELWAAPPDAGRHPHDLAVEPSVHVARLDGTAVCDGRVLLDRAAPHPLLDVPPPARCRRPACRRRYDDADADHTDRLTRGTR